MLYMLILYIADVARKYHVMAALPNIGVEKVWLRWDRPAAAAVAAAGSKWSKGTYFMTYFYALISTIVSGVL